MLLGLSLFQNSIGFGTSSWTNRSKPGLSSKSMEAVPKTEVLEQPRLVKSGNFGALDFTLRPRYGSSYGS
jgi:hypothetical protein